jgi:hypothetical protein
VSGDSRLRLINAAGKLVSSLQVRDDYVTACLSGNRVVVFRDIPGSPAVTVTVYPPSLTKPLAIWRVRHPETGWFGDGTDNGLLPYKSGDAFHLLDLASGRDHMLTVHAGLTPNRAWLTSAGLFYTAIRPYTAGKAEAGFVPMARLQAAIR